VDQHTVEVYISSRTDQPNQWLTTQYNSLTNKVIMDGFELKVANVYRRIL
jgi:Uma2 family endonuclease